MKAKYFLLQTPKLRSEVDIKYQKQKSAKYWPYKQRFWQFLFVLIRQDQIVHRLKLRARLKYLTGLPGHSPGRF